MESVSIRGDWDRYKNIGNGDIDKFSFALEYNFDI
jgi:hypothetical protein